MKEEELKEKIKTYRESIISYPYRLTKHRGIDVDVLIRLVKQQGRQSKLKDVLELIINFKNRLHKDEYKVWDERRVLSLLEQLNKELSGGEE